MLSATAVGTGLVVSVMYGYRLGTMWDLVRGRTQGIGVARSVRWAARLGPSRVAAHLSGPPPPDVDGRPRQIGLDDEPVDATEFNEHTPRPN